MLTIVYKQPLPKNSSAESKNPVLKHFVGNTFLTKRLEQVFFDFDVVLSFRPINKSTFKLFFRIVFFPALNFNYSVYTKDYDEKIELKEQTKLIDSLFSELNEFFDDFHEDILEYCNKVNEIFKENSIFDIVKIAIAQDNTKSRESCESAVFEESKLWQGSDAYTPNMEYLVDLMNVYNNCHTPSRIRENFLANLGNALAKRPYHPERANFFIVPIMDPRDALELISSDKNSGIYWSANTRTKRGDVVLLYFGKKADRKFCEDCQDNEWRSFFDNIHGSVFGTARILTDIFDDKKRGYGGKWVFFSDIFIYDRPINIFELSDEFGNQVSEPITKAGFFKPKFLPEGIPFLDAFRKADAGRSTHFKVSRPDVPRFPGHDTSDDSWANCFREIEEHRFISEEAVEAYFVTPFLKRVLPEGYTINTNFSFFKPEKELQDFAPFLPVFSRLRIDSNLENLALKDNEDRALFCSPFKTIILFSENNVVKVSFPGRYRRIEILFRRKSMTGKTIAAFRNWLLDYFFKPDQITKTLGTENA